MSTGNYIPMITWNNGANNYTFPDPPSGDPLGEVFAADWDTIVANKGQMNVQYNFTEHTLTVTYVFLSESDKTAIQNFFDIWGKLGNTFQYYEHSNLPAYWNCQLATGKLQWKALMADGSGGMIYQMTWTLRTFYL